MAQWRDEEFEAEYAWLDEQLVDEFRHKNPIAASKTPVFTSPQPPTESPHGQGAFFANVNRYH
jgi:hypothetical protein